MSPITLGILAASGAGLPATYELISTILVTSNTASVTFSNLGTAAAGYKHLQIRGVAHSAGTASDNIDLRFNGDAGNNYAYHAIWGNGSSVGSENSTSRSNAASVIGSRSSSDTNAFDAAVIDILDFASSTKTKTLRSLRGSTGATGNTLYLVSDGWFSTAPVTSITLSGRAASIGTGSRFSLYGIRG